MSLASKFRVMAALAQHLEGDDMENDFAFIDNNETLEISTTALAYLRNSQYGRQLLTEWESVNGQISEYDPTTGQHVSDIDWEVLFE